MANLFLKSGKPVTHGRAATYNNHGCKCDECKTAWAEYMRPRVKAHRDKVKDKKRLVADAARQDSAR